MAHPRQVLPRNVDGEFERRGGNDAPFGAGLSSLIPGVFDDEARPLEGVEVADAASKTNSRGQQQMCCREQEKSEKANKYIAYRLYSGIAGAHAGCYERPGDSLFSALCDG